MAGNGNTHTHAGVAIHIYVANASMTDRFFYNADGEMLIVPQTGRLLLRTEMGVLEAGPGEIAVIQRGIRFRVELLEKEARGYICENYGALLRLPDLGPIGANGLANPRDFLAPVAAFEDREGDFRIVTKFQGRLWAAAIDHSPLNVVAWHGNYVPYKYDLANFQLHQHGELRSSRSIDLHGADFAVGNSRNRQCGLRNLSAALDGGRAYVSSAVVSSQLHERVHGADPRGI